MHSHKFDVYLYSQKGDSVLPIHAWLGLHAQDGSKTVQLDSKWWDKQQDLHVNLQYVPNGFQPWETSYPLGTTWILSANSSETPSNLDTSPSWSNAQVTDYNHHSNGLSSGQLAAAIVLPILAALAMIGAGFFWHRIRVKKRETASSERSMKQAGSRADHSAVSFNSPQYAYDSSALPGYVTAMHDSNVSMVDAKDSPGPLYLDSSFSTQNDLVPHDVYAYEQPYTYQTAPLPHDTTEAANPDSDADKGCRHTRKHKRKRPSKKPLAFESRTWSRSGSLQPDEYNVPELVSCENGNATPYKIQETTSNAQLTGLDQTHGQTDDLDKSSSISDGPAMYELDGGIAPPLPKSTRKAPSLGPKLPNKSISLVEPSTEESRNQRVLSYLAGVAASQGDHGNHNITYDNRGGLSSRRPSYDCDVFQDAETM